jgi:cytochrome c-type biogenesis protein CcmH
MRASGLLIVLAMMASLAVAAEEPALGQAQEGRYYGLLKELRCLVCQNESLYESRSGLADDLRREVRTMLVQGKSDEDILSFMTARYGDYVLYRPRMRPANYLLWFGPWLLLIAGLRFVYKIWKCQADEHRSADPLSAEDHRRLQELVGEQEPDKK